MNIDQLETRNRLTELSVELGSILLEAAYNRMLSSGYCACCDRHIHKDTHDPACKLEEYAKLHYDLVINDQPTEPHDDYDKECLMPVDEFLEGVKSGHFIDYDGSGHWATETHHCEHRVCPSDISVLKRVPPAWATHICWYNR